MSEQNGADKNDESQGQADDLAGLIRLRTLKRLHSLRFRPWSDEREEHGFATQNRSFHVQGTPATGPFAVPSSARVRRGKRIPKWIDGLKRGEV